MNSVKQLGEPVKAAFNQLSYNEIVFWPDFGKDESFIDGSRFKMNSESLCISEQDLQN